MSRTCDIMVCAMSRLLRDRETVFFGVASHLPMVAALLAKATHAPSLTILNIPGGADTEAPVMESFSSAGGGLLVTAPALFPLAEVFDLSMRGGLDVAFLSGVQFDSTGAVNASVIGDYFTPKVRLPGGAGSAVLIPTAKRAVIWRTKHDQRTFVKEVDFVTSRGNVSAIVTPLCIFHRYRSQLIVSSVHPGSNMEEVAMHTGFPLRYLELKVTPAPSAEELTLLEQIDPLDLRSLEFR